MILNSHTSVRVLGVLMTLALTNFAIAEEPVNPSASFYGTESVPEVTATPSAVPPDGVNMLNVAPVAVLTAKDYITVNTTPTNGKGQFQGIQYTVKNLQPNHIQVIHAEVINGVDEIVAAQQEAEDSRRKKRFAGGLIRGIAGVGLSALPYTGAASYGVARAAVAGSQIANTAAHSIESSAEMTQAQFEGRFVRQFSSVVISPNDTFNFSTLVAPGTNPQLKIVFKDLKTNEIYDIQQ